MSSPPRALPDRPSLRFLKLEAKRRCAAGEFAALHDAQAAIARDHGLPDWAALKLLIADAEQESHALTQLRWIIGRFSGAGQPGWTAPDDAEMRAHFAESFLEPLGMTESSFRASPETVTGYELTVGGVFETVPPLIPVLEAAGGLWSTANDLLRLAARWRQLMPGDLARQALTPLVGTGPHQPEVAMGLGWLLLPGKGIAIAAGALPGFTACLMTGRRAEHVHLSFTNRLIPLDRITQPVQRLWGT
jgi:beta-lactamase family protein